MAHVIRTALCVDGSASVSKKRPVYRIDFHDGTTTIHRWRHKHGILGMLDRQFDRLPMPVLVAVDVPIGLPSDFNEVLGEHNGFLEWLAHRDGDWRNLVACSIAEQTADRPFVVCRKGEKKRDGRFPLRVCDRLTQAESTYWCVGGKQVGKAALQFWYDTLRPLQSHFGERLGVWPFEPIEGKDVVIAECYPAMFYERVWNRQVTKTDPCNVVDAVNAKRQEIARPCDEKTWLHAVSSEDEFDMFTVALAIAKSNGNLLRVLTAPELLQVRTVEGWMLGLDVRAPSGPKSHSPWAERASDFADQASVT
jgi:hypothetical protein